MFDRRLLEYFAWGLLGLSLLLGLSGLCTVYSAVTAGEGAVPSILHIKQSVWFGVGLVLMVATFLFSYKSLERWAPETYVCCIILLICVLLFGKYGGGSRRWLLLGPISVQPSELTKIAIVVVLARYYSRVDAARGLTLRELFVPLVLVLIPFVLIRRQPDLGSAGLMLLIAGSMTLFVKIEKRSLIAIVASLLVTVPSVWFFLTGYQKQRILTFLSPGRDPLGAGYHIIQSKIAIGSGMITGKGFLEGTQNALSFLPEEHTDFIFSVLAEEWGFVGSAALLVGFMVLISWGLKIAHDCRNLFGMLLAIGATAVVFWQVVINVGMVMGLMPVVGIPLPLISYGGSSVVSTMVCIGLLLNISMRRFMMD